MERLLSQFHAWLVAGGPDVLHFEPAVTVLHARAFTGFLAGRGADPLAVISRRDSCELWMFRFTNHLRDRGELRDLDLVQTSIRLFAGFLTMPGAGDDAPEGGSAEDIARINRPPADG